MNPQQQQAQMQQAQADRNRFRDPKALMEAFYHFDRDGSGSIPTDELVGIIQNNGKRMRQEEIDDFRAECDPQNSGRCNYQQFIQILTAGLNAR